MFTRMRRAAPLLASCFVFTVSVAAAEAPPPRFPERPAFTIAPPALSDAGLRGLLGTLDAFVARIAPSAPWAEAAADPVGEFVRQCEMYRLTAAQQTRIASHLTAIARAHPAGAPLLDRARASIGAIGVGKPAPEIGGPDLDGREFRLSDYRGKVVVLTFTGEWCAICRTQEPYQRLLLDLYKEWPFAILGVDAGETPASVKRARASAKVPYRGWWDGGANGHAGSIATAWSVVGFPRVFVIDRQGVVRFVDVRDEDLLKAVRQLLDEPAGPQSGSDAVLRARGADEKKMSAIRQPSTYRRATTRSSP
jgi:peroxiredoxin